jgi:hypothetical protein
MNYNGFKLAVASTMAATMWVGALSAFFFAPVATRRPSTGK